MPTLTPLEAQIEETVASQPVMELAQQLAIAHQAASAPCQRTPLHHDFPKIGGLLAAAYKQFQEEAQSTLAVSYAAEWMLDNYYLIQQTLREIHQDLPPGYYAELPTVGGADPFCGYPRIYGVAATIVWQADYQLDAERIVQFALSYQTHQPLSTGELWALPIMLRLVLLQIIALAAGRLSGRIAEGVLPESITVFQNAAAAGDYAPPERDESSVAHAIPSLRLLAALDWMEMFERVSLVHGALCNDPAGVYPYLDFRSRNDYRRVIEALHRRLEVSEVAVAEAAIALAAQQTPADFAHDHGAEAEQGDSELYPGLDIHIARAAHVGYYLVDVGRLLLEARLGYHPTMRERAGRWLRRHATGVYLTAIGVITLSAIVTASAYALATGGGLPALVILWLVGLIPAMTAGVSITNWLVTHIVPPCSLPKLAFQRGIPASCRTAVVVPALLAVEGDVDSLLEQLEQHYVRNPDPQLVYLLLTDFADAGHESEPDDATLLDRAQAAVQALNARTPGAPFYILHRRRQWNPAQQKWMGWERKRGKLHEFNRLIRGAADTSYAWCVGDLSQLGHIRYVITLDADTVLPRGAAARLVGALAHPLNRAEFDDRTGNVCAGYTILQPRTEIKPVIAGRSRFTRIFAGDNSLDLYTLAVSDVYQDVFGAGIYVGKGIYDLDAFERSLAGRVPANALLSHDLFEGIHGRAALVTDIVLYEDYPTHFLIRMQRAHRWVRGDWQLLPWLLPRPPRQEGATPNDLALIDRWKIVDNLRRSLFAPALLLLFVAGWTVLPGSPLLWTLVGVMMPALAIAGSLATWVVRLFSSQTCWRSLLGDARTGALRWGAFLVFLPYEAHLNLDAIVRTLVRTWITRRCMLEWTTTAQATQLHLANGSTQTTLLEMRPCLLFAALLGLLILATKHSALIIAAPFLWAWASSALLSDWISRPAMHQAATLTPDEQRTLRTLARRTWLFYENFVGPRDNWLPPDHFQESPRGVVAHRTSPTNIGLYLLSALAAFDLGYIRLANFILRVKFTFDTLDQMDRYRGHFLNWVDTSDLRPLPPAYVSTVDSGNLAAALVSLQQACIELREQEVYRPVRWQGLLDTISVVTDTLRAASKRSAYSGSTAALCDCLDEIEVVVQKAILDPSHAPAALANLLGPHHERLDQRLGDVAADETSPLDADTLHIVRLYLARAQQHLEGIRSKQEEALPWLSLLATSPSIFDADDSSPALRHAWAQLVSLLSSTPRWTEMEAFVAQAHLALCSLRTQVEATTAGAATVQGTFEWCDELHDALHAAKRHAVSMLDDLEQVAARAGSYVDAMDFGFLYDHRRALFHIGYNIATSELDNSYYDLLASEARIASLIAIGKNDVPVTHWLHLSRPLTRPGGHAPALLSWSGTMFEYLMPPLLLRTYPDTLFHQTFGSVIDYQIDYCRARNVPWGISESGYYAFDAAMNYQYRAFGVPGLGLRRGLGEDLVVTPYASLLALSLRPKRVLSNLRQLQDIHMMGAFGLYEAIDFTTERLGIGQESAIVHSYMAHHQGMILLALADALLNGRMLERFHAAPLSKSIDLLLQEQIPPAAPLHFPHAAEADEHDAAPVIEEIAPWRPPIDTPMPQVHYLSNGSLSELITNAGAGCYADQTLRLTRWRADTTLDEWGCWVYVQVMKDGALWSAGRQPTGERSIHEEVSFHPHMAEFRRRHGPISLHMATMIAPEADVGVRRITLTNDDDAAHQVGIISYGEVVLAPEQADQRHQAFTKLFVESEALDELPGLLFRRRPRSSDEAPAFLLHLLVRGPAPPEVAWGVTRRLADRARFIGRSGSLRAPTLLQDDSWWTTEAKECAGATLDPAMVLGQEVWLAPRTSAQIAFVTVRSATRAEAIEIGRIYSAWSAVERAQSRAQSQMKHELRQLGFDSETFQQALQLLSLAIYPHAVCRAEPAMLAANTRGQSGLWAHGISGDYPILLVHLDEERHTELLQEVLRIHTYARRRGLKIDLVVVNDRDSSYDQGLHNHIFRVIRRMASETALNQRGGIFVLRRDQLGGPERTLLESVARVVLEGRRGALAHHLAGLYRQPLALPHFEPICTPEQLQALQECEQGWLPRPQNLQFDNEFGGFSPDGKEYVIYLAPGETTPAPWINVIANAKFGFSASEHGSGASWAINSGENRLTPWRNDPVMDIPAEIVYLRDELTAEVWSPTPRPTPAPAPYLIRHGAGYTIYEHHSHALRQRLELSCARQAPVKFMRLRLENTAPVARRLTVTCYAEWVLGVDREMTQAYIAPEYEEQSGALLAHNAYNEEFGTHVVFLAANKTPHGATADRTSFLGRLGSLQQPAALQRIGLNDAVHSGLDPCAALQVHVDLPAGGVEEVCFLLGQGADRQEAIALIERYRPVAAAGAACREMQQQWEDILESIQVETPDPAINLLLNRWLLYQALSCRIWGRSALYQSSGAYGFRDQLQDVMALFHVRPDIARAQILRASQRQFEDGDVLHWWHPPSGRGVRTRISDDLLWLPYVTARYVAATGDTTILEESAPFLTGPTLGDEEAERYGYYEPSGAPASLLEHCRRALERGVTAGPHGIPLIGVGDWNDGMNRVGVAGKGESIWLGWFATAALTAFAELCERAELPGGDDYRRRAQEIVAAVEVHGWDGAWYRRAYYDDGTPLGSAENRECRIDAIAQSWAVLSGAAEPARARRAMDAVLEYLVKEEDRLLLLFTPPLDKTPRDPGYIKGYLPGVRENGGQYTHAAIWSIWALAALGDAARAVHLFRLINPILRSDTRAKARRYHVEPYVISADVYGVAPHIGRGGWTWYTGSAAWMYRLGVEAILGLKLAGDVLHIEPCIPATWPGFRVRWRRGGSEHLIEVENRPESGGAIRITFDGKPHAGNCIPLVNDGKQHKIVVHLAKTPA